MKMAERFVAVLLFIYISNDGHFLFSVFETYIIIVIMSVFSAFFFRVTKEKQEPLEEMSVNPLFPYLIVSLLYFLTSCCLHPACSFALSTI